MGGTIISNLCICRQSLSTIYAFPLPRSRCGAETVPVETGLRRRCVLVPDHKLYPRTDPVVIMLVESPDGQRALLGRSKKFAAGTQQPVHIILSAAA